MKTRTLLFLSFFCFLLLPGSALAKKPGNTVLVDCGKGDSLAKALENPADPLTVELRGVCREHVVIRRHNVHLHGTDPLIDGIAWPAGVPGASALVVVDNAEGVVLENISISASELIGLGIWDDSVLQLRNVRVSDSARTGIHISGSSYVTASDTVVSGNGINGLSVGFSAQMRCYAGCRLEGNVNWQLYVRDGGRVVLADSVISGRRGIVLFENGMAAIQNTDVTATSGPGVWSSEFGDFNWFGGSLSGPIRMDWKALGYFQGVAQVSNPGANTVENDSTMMLDNTQLIGETAIRTFSNGQATGGTTLGDLVCESGGGFYCDGTESKSSSTCGLCP